MIDVEKILAVKKIVVHKYCHDGTSSAMIIKDVLQNVEVFFAGHKDKNYLDMAAEPGLLFCDIAPPPCVKTNKCTEWNSESGEPRPQCCIDREREFLDAGSIVLDHHEARKDYVLQFQKIGLGVYGENDDGISGAVLAYRHIWSPLADIAKTEKRIVCKLARLAGIRDTFQTESIEWDDAQEQMETLAFFSSEHFLTNNHPAGILPEEQKIGALICVRNKTILKKIVESVFILPWDNVKVAIIPGHKIISDAAEELRKNGIPITFSFGFRVSDYGTPVVAVSVRSDGTFNCNKFAKFLGGGGHIPAAGGISFKVKDDTLNPYSLIRDALNKYGKECWINA